MKSILALALFGTTIVQASTHGLEQIRCNDVLGPAYQVVINGDSLKLNDTQSFPLSACRFEPFSVNLKCRHKGASLEVALTKVTATGGGSFHAVDFHVDGVEGVDSHRFETMKIDLGKSSRCYVNDTYEIR